MAPWPREVVSVLHDVDFGRLFESSPVRSLVLAPTHGWTVVAASAGFLASVGRQHQEVVGHPVLLSIPDEPDLKHALEQVLQNQQSGGPVPIAGGLQQAVLHPLVDAAGRLNHIHLLLTDPSDSSWRGTLQELQEAVTEREEVLSVATHELKTPIASMQLKLEMLRRRANKTTTVDSPSLLGALEPVMGQLHRLNRIIDDLLDITRLRNRRLRLEIEAVDLRQLVAECVRRVRELSTWTPSVIELAEGPPVIGYWDPVRIEQIATNLLTNAVKYGRGEPVKVSLEADEATARLQVKDRGIGIAPEDQERIFQRFERLTLEHQDHSLGLGLYIVRELVNAHGGSIQLESEQGKGSTFTIELPRYRMPNVGKLRRDTQD